MEIVFGDCVALGGHYWTLILVDVYKSYLYMYGMISLSLTSIISALEDFKSESGQLPCHFHSDFYKKLIGGKVLIRILSKK